MMRSGSQAILPSWQKIKHSAKKAGRRTDTWLPAVGALAIQAGDTDQKISTWARSKTPLYQSPENASDMSDQMRDSSKVIFYSTLLLAPQGNSFQEESMNFLLDFGVGQSSLVMVNGATAYLKSTIGRTRPNGVGNHSFPSHHTASSIGHGALAKRNLESISMSPKRRIFTNGLITSLGVATGWARVEASAHYPSDVLAGAALANFTTHFMYNLFFDDKRGSNIIVAPVPEEHGAKIKIQIPF